MHQKIPYACFTVQDTKSDDVSQQMSEANKIILWLAYSL